MKTKNTKNAKHPLEFNQISIKTVSIFVHHYFFLYIFFSEITYINDYFDNKSDPSVGKFINAFLVQ